MKQIHLNLRAWLVSLAALLAALPACADVTIDQLSFYEVDGGYGVTQTWGATLEGALVIPETYNGKPVVEIGYRAFWECSGLTSVTIPNTVTTIGEWAFYYCEGLKSITIPDAVTTIGNAAFENCYGLTSVHIGYGVTTIGEWAFLYCTRLTSITIPDGVTTIGKDAFYNCSALTSVHIGNGVTTIGYEAFSHCFGLREIICFATTPPNISYNYYSSTFDNIHYAEATVYVPEEAVEAYRQDENWSRFQNIVGKNLASVGRIEAGSVENAASATAVYDLRGAKVAASPEGLPQGTYIVRDGQKTKKISVK